MLEWVMLAGELLENKVHFKLHKVKHKSLLLHLVWQFKFPYNELVPPADETVNQVTSSAQLRVASCKS